MYSSNRTLLVIEDDKTLNEMYRLYCQEALQDLPHVHGTVKQAFGYNQARQILQSGPVDFVSVDLALSREEEGKTDLDREKGEAGGMTLLKQLQKTARPPVAVVVSGETLQSYAIDAYQDYGILAFYQKARLDIEEYKHAVKAALWYLDAAALIEKPEIETAARFWENALAAAKTAGIREKNFPASIGQKIKDRWTHPVTNLPVGHWTEEKLRNRVVEQDDWALIRITMDGFNQFVANFASQEEPVLNFAVTVFQQACQGYQNLACEMGHLGYEYTLEPSFVIIFNRQALPYVDDIAARIKQEFEQKVHLFLPEFETPNARQRITPTLDTKVLKGGSENFEDLHRLLDTLGLAES